MASSKDEDGDFYTVLGLNKDCSQTELRTAYKKLALRWHPDRCSSSGCSKQVKESKENFQAIQKAYSVLSDTNKRFLYDVGVYDSEDQDDDDMREFLEEMGTMMNRTSSTGMHEFLDEMGTMMNEASSSANKLDSFESLQDLFDEMFPGNITGFSSTSNSKTSNLRNHSKGSCFNKGNDKGNCKRNSAERNFSEVNTEGLSDFKPFEADSLNDHVFCFVAGGTKTEASRRGSKQKSERKQKASVRRS